MSLCDVHRVGLSLYHCDLQGYAGGIVSAAVDGERVATVLLEELAGVGLAAKVVV